MKRRGPSATERSGLKGFASMLRTVEESFGVPLLGDAANATELSSLFTTFP